MPLFVSRGVINTLLSPERSVYLSWHPHFLVVSADAPPTAEWLIERGVPEDLSSPTLWSNIACERDDVLLKSTHKGQLLANYCPGVVFCGADQRRPGSVHGSNWAWTALPGPATPKSDSAFSLSTRLPVMEDGLSLGDGQKVTVWVFRHATPKMAEPVGYHLNAGVFDDHDAEPGMNVVGWVPLLPQPAPRFATNNRPRP